VWCIHIYVVDFKVVGWSLWDPLVCVVGADRRQFDGGWASFLAAASAALMACFSSAARNLRSVSHHIALMAGGPVVDGSPSGL